MAKARLYFDGDNTYIEKEARIYKMVDEIGDKIDNIPGVINDLNSTSETDALSAAMGKELQDQINALSGNFHFLSSWDCTTGLPGSDPATDPYTYQSGDYYIVSTVASGGGTNYKPHGSSYTHGVASTAVETQPVQMNDWYVYDGSTWILQPSGGAQIVVDTALSTTSTNPVENRVITQALNNKQNTISNLATIEAGAAAGATAVQPGANISVFTNNAGYQTAGDVASAISGKQDTMSAGDGISITSNTIANTKPGPTISAVAPSNPTEGMLWYDSSNDVLKVYNGSTWDEVGTQECYTGGTDIEIVPGGRLHNLPTGYTELEYVTATGDQLITLNLTGDAVVDFKAQGVTPMSASNVLFDSSQNGGVGYYYGGLTTDSGIWAYTTIPFYTDVTGHLSYVGNAVEGTVGSASVSRSRETTITRGTWTLFGTMSQTLGYQFLFYGRLYYFKATQNGAVTYNLITAKNSSDVAGLYDIVNNVFYTSSRTALTAGPVATEGCNVINFTNTSGYLQKSNYRLIKATTSTPFNTRDKICTTAEGNYVPQEGDVLSVIFTNGCGVGSPRLDIDNSGLHSIVISSTGGANAATLWLGMSKIAWMFVYDGTNRVTWPIKDTLYDAGSGISISSQTITNTRPGPTVSGTAPASPSEGAMWYDSTNDVLKVYDGTNWQEVGSGGGSTCLVGGTDISVGPVSDLPEGYTELQWIGVSSSALTLNYSGLNKRIVFDAMSTQTSGQTGVQIIASYDSDYLGCFGGTYNRTWAVQTDTGNTGVSADNRTTVTFTFDSGNSSYNRATVTAGGVTKTWTRTSVRTGGNLNLFGAVEGSTLVQSTFKGNIYSVKIYDNTTNLLISDLVPCKNPSNAVGMYDLVGGTFYPASKGSFTAGDEVDASCTKISFTNASGYIKDENLVAGTGIQIDRATPSRVPVGYTELEWIQSDEHCGINSGKKIHEITKVETVGNFVQNNGGFRCIVGVDDQSLTENQGRYGVLLGEGTDGAWYIQASTYSSPKEPFTYSSVTPDTNEHTFSAYYSNGYTYISVDGIADSVAGNRPANIQDNIGIFSRYVGASNTWSSVGSMFKMKSIKMWNGNTVVFDGVPCKRNSDNELGLYDTVSETFLTNSNTGTLLGGSEVVPVNTTTISSTVLDFTNLTYDSLASDTWSATSSVAFPSTAKVAFITWRAIKGSVIYAAGETIFPRTNGFIKSSFIGGGASSSEFVSGGIMYDYQTGNIVYTKTDGAGSVLIDYAIYFYK